jgi:glycosyltransferase involved in cell wall biosynthesis
MSAGGRARVVVGLPVHNSERFLRDTLASVAAQDYPHLEVVISDDASTDGTPAICREQAARDPRFRVERHEGRVGWIANYNSLLRHATGDYFLWVPHDDLYDSAYVGALVALLEARPGAVLAYSTTLGVDETGTVVRTWTGNDALHRATTPLARGLRYLWWYEAEKFIPFRGVVRSAALRTVGGLEVGPWEVYADDLWLFRLALLGDFAHDARPLCRKRLYQGSVSTTYRYTYRQRNAYLAGHRRLVREAGLGWRTACVLHLSIALRQAWVALWWLSRATRRRLRGLSTRLRRAPERP